ncbi:hypothetical protein ACSXCW_03630 [Clostridium perfringens]
MDKLKADLENELKKLEGLALAIAFFIFGLLMILNFFKFNIIFSKVIGIIALFISFVGLTIEIKNLLGEGKEKRFIGIPNIILGSMFFAISTYIIFKVDLMIVSVVMCFINFFSIYGFTSGIVKFLGCLNKQVFKENIIKSIFLFTVQITTLALTLLQLYDILIKKNII